MRTLDAGPPIRQALVLPPRIVVGDGWRVVRSSEAALLERARASYAALPAGVRQRKTRLDVRLFGSAGSPLKAVFVADGETITVRTEINLAPASKRALDDAALREQLGRLGETPFVLARARDGRARAGPVPADQRDQSSASAGDRRAAAASRLGARGDARRASRHGGRGARRSRRHPHAATPSRIERAQQSSPHSPFDLVASVFTLDDARAAAAAGATTVVLDVFLRHPTPPVTRVRALAEELAAQGVTLRLRTPTIVRPEERRTVQKWLDLGLPLLSGHLGLVAELARAGRDVIADYAVNCFNQHTAAELFRLGARRITLSVELTTDELLAVAAPWEGDGFDVLLYGRPEGMTIEHCVLSAAFDRVPTTCRDLCVQKHTNVELTDPTGYTLPRRHRFGVSQPAAALAPDRGRRVPAAALARRASATTTSCSTSSAIRSRRSSPAIAPCSSSSPAGQRQVAEPRARRRAATRSRADTSLVRSSDAVRDERMTRRAVARRTLTA